MNGSVKEGPDFLCIGMGKSGTTWIFDQCQYHPDFWMPPIKELHYLDSEFPRRTSNRFLRRSNETALTKREQQGHRPLEDRDFVFLKEMRDVKGQPMNLERYAEMFRFKGDQLSGDVTPSYCTIPEDLIARVMARFPDVKIVFMIRDPVSRAWSHLLMKQRGDKIEASSLLEPDKFRALLQASKLTKTGSAAELERKWLRHVPPSQFRHYFFEDLVSDSHAVSTDVLAFLGSDPARNPVEPSHNRKAEKPKLRMSAEIREILVQQFAGEIADCAGYFGGHANGWAAKYGIGAGERSPVAAAAQG